MQSLLLRISITYFIRGAMGFQVNTTPLRPRCASAKGLLNLITSDDLRVTLGLGLLKEVSVLKST